ncbi:Resolvase, N terminal domain [Alicyclobacillus hesperidum]|uniref:Resolvase, N terminal domain n=2 Tax=Alicyclobacillus hesperidum TaxID=89784 RepID=A0A1H2V7C2_9BACL|nr:recombinase family protein [Alicyclobacillus hesperidum]SDW63799.1 Resolvase, N terminal domain [Alicyclobacillus hesperidum]
MKQRRNGVAYLRRSSERQRQNHSLEIQRSQVLRCAELNGYEIIEWFIDDAVSAYRKPALKRDAMKALLTTVLEHDAVNGVFFYDESRVSRQMSDFVLQVFNPIKERKPQCEFFNATTGLWDPKSPVVQAQLLMAQYDSTVKSTRAIDAQSMLLHDPRGPRRPGAPAPYGYQWHNGVLVPGETAGVALFIFYLASWGYADAQIAVILNKAGIPSPRSGEWRTSTIDVVLNNPVYCGNLAWNRRKGYSNSARKPIGQYDLFEGQIDAIVPRPLWDIVHELRTVKKETGMKFNTPNLLQGLAHCKKCGVGLLVKDSTPARSSKRYVHYVCPSCGQKIATSKLDEVVLKQIAREWPGRISLFKSQARNTLVRWKKEILVAQRNANAELEEARYQRATLSTSTPYAEKWEQLISLRETASKEKVQRSISLLEEVSALSQNSTFDDWIARFMETDWVNLLSDTERRTFCFFVIQQVDVDFTTVAKVSICFRLSPFVNLAKSIGCLTEFDADTVGEKPNEQQGA